MTAAAAAAGASYCSCWRQLLQPAADLNAEWGSGKDLTSRIDAVSLERPVVAVLPARVVRISTLNACPADFRPYSALMMYTTSSSPSPLYSRSSGGIRAHGRVGGRERPLNERHER
eukprot:scaffold52988_cov68-Phaeocystis_antarctica.AAC.17